MKRKEFIEFHKLLCETARKLCTKKSEGYGISEVDWMSNIKEAARLCKISPSIGCLNRFLDKVHRLTNLIVSGSKDEDSVKDQIVDIINYGLILYVLWGESKNEKPNKI